MTKADKNQLTIKLERFVQEYMLHGDASKAYRAAYESENMKPETVNRAAKTLMDNSKIGARIKNK